MKGYCKMKSLSNAKSRSIDFSDLFSSSSSSSPSFLHHYDEHYETTPTPRSSSSSKLSNSTTQNPNSRFQAPKTQIKKLDPFPEKEEEGHDNDHRHHHQHHDDQEGYPGNFTHNNKVGDHEMGFDDGGDSDLKKINRARSTSSSATIKRVFSMRRSFSVSSSSSDRYCRIHDQSVTLASSPIQDIHEDDDDSVTARSAKKKNQTKSKILKACKKIFGL